MSKQEIVLVDLSNLFRRAWHASENNETSFAIGETKRLLSRAIGDRRNRLVVIACDGKNSFRKQLDPSYKANREKAPQTLYGTLDQLKEDLLREGELLWEVETFEADDIIATAHDYAITSGHEVVIVSSDKDLLQLIKPGVRALRIDTWEYVDEAWVTAKFGVAPVLIGDWLAIAGDKSDNVVGIEGAGPVCAAAVLGHFGNLNSFLDAVEENGIGAIATPKLSKFRAALTKFANEAGGAARIRASRKLVELRFDVPVKWDEVYAERGQSGGAEEPAGDTDPTTTEAAAVPTPAPDEAPIPSGAPSPAAPSAAAKAPSAAAQQPAPSVPAEIAVLREKAAIEEKALVFSQFGSDLQPTGMAALYWLARRIIETKSGKFKNADEALMVMLRGRDFGIKPAAAADMFHVIEGKPCPPASVLIASAQSHPDCEYMYPAKVDSQTEAAYVVKHKKSPEPVTVTYTIQDAEQAGLLEIQKDGSVRAMSRNGRPGTWMKFTRDLLVKSAGLKAARWFFPAAMQGAYAYEEIPGAE